MRMSMNWLKEYVNLDGVTPEVLAEKLTIAGLEVEGIEKMAEGTNLVIGQVLTCENHPDSDHLHVTTVNVGDEVLNIVCGAPNVRAGQKVIVSKVGAVLAGGFEIKPAKVRGMESNGMICSLSELGVDKKAQTEEQLNGIYVFDDEAPVGETRVLEYLGLDDTILDIGLTPNRADCNASAGAKIHLNFPCNVRKTGIITPTIKVNSQKPAGQNGSQRVTVPLFSQVLLLLIL